MAVSVRPFLDPLELVTYSKTESPSLKLDLIGSSTIFPRGSTTSPRIAASCLTWSREARPTRASITTLIGFSGSICSHVLSASSSVTSIQTSWDSLLFSSEVPRRFASRSIGGSGTYCCQFSHHFDERHIHRGEKCFL